MGNWKIQSQILRYPTIWIKREIQDILPAIQDQYPVCVVTGSRQVGTTSLLQATFPDTPYMSLDLPFDAERAETNSQLFLEQLGALDG